MVQGQWTGCLTILGSDLRGEMAPSVRGSANPCSIHFHRNDSPKAKSSCSILLPHSASSVLESSHTSFALHDNPGRNDYSYFPERGTEAVRSCDLSKAVELGHSRSPLSSGPHWLPGNLSSFINASQSQRLVLLFIQKLFTGF